MGTIQWLMIKASVVRSNIMTRNWYNHNERKKILQINMIDITAAHSTVPSPFCLRPLLRFIEEEFTHKHTHDVLVVQYKMVSFFFSHDVIISLTDIAVVTLGPFRLSLMSRRNTERFCVNLPKKGSEINMENNPSEIKQPWWSQTV